jgi:hypothetical protein
MKKIQLGLSLLLFASVGIFGCRMSTPPVQQDGSFSSSGTPGQGVVTPSPYKPDWSGQPAAVRAAIAIQDRHTKDLMAIPGVIGTGVGVDEQHPEQAVIEVFTSREGVQGIPASVEGVNTRIEYTGPVQAFGGRTSWTGKYRGPIYCGVSTGNNNECASGSIGALVTTSLTGNTTGNSGSITVYSGGASSTGYLLSNNHVFARENAATSAEQEDQPGRYDNNCNAGNGIASLYAWNFISSTSNNLYDVALAGCSSSETWTPYMWNGSNGALYKPTNSVATPIVGLSVTKVGRTTGYTTGSISGINVTITVGYSGFNATFVNQIYVRGTFIKAGDSGSMMCDASGDPVGLDFAGSNTASFANPMAPIANDFGLSFVQ